MDKGIRPIELKDLGVLRDVLVEIAKGKLGKYIPVVDKRMLPHV